MQRRRYIWPPHTHQWHLRICPTMVLCHSLARQLFKGSNRWKPLGPYWQPDVSLVSAMFSGYEPHSVSSNPVPSNSEHSGPVKKHLVGRQFASHTEVMQAISSWLNTLDTSFFYATTQASTPHWNEYLNVNGEWMQDQRILSATYKPCIYQSQNDILNIVFFWSSLTKTYMASRPRQVTDMSSHMA